MKTQLLWAQAPSIAHNFSDLVLERMARREGRVDLDELRVFFPGWGWDDDPEFYVMPFHQTVTGLWNWDKPDKQWDENVKRLIKIFKGTRIYPKDQYDKRKSNVWIRMSYIDHCCFKQDSNWNIWKYNIHGPKGMYDASDKALDIFKGLFDRLWDLGIRRFDAGNEIVAPETNTQGQLYDWVKKYAVRHLAYLMSKGAKPAFTFSANERTAHAYRGIVADELGKNKLAQIYHQAMIPEKLPQKTDLSFLAYYGISCDGMQMKDYPVSRQGVWTDNHKQCDSSVKEHEKSAVEFNKRATRGRFRFFEHLAFEIDEKQSPDNLRQKESVSVFWKVPKKITGKDRRRLKREE